MSRTASVKGNPSTAMSASEIAKQAVEMFDVLRRRKCLNIVQQTIRFPPIAAITVVQKLDSAIHRINLYPVDNAISFPNTYPLDSDLSGGLRYPIFEQLGPDF